LLGLFAAFSVCDVVGAIAGAGGVKAAGGGGASMMSLAIRGGKLATSVDDRVGVGTKDKPQASNPYAKVHAPNASRKSRSWGSSVASQV
jgi:hypothetical protein